MPVPLLDTIVIVTSVHVTRRYREKCVDSRAFLWQYTTQWNVVWELFFIKQIFERKLANLLQKKCGLTEVEIRITFYLYFCISEVFLSNMKLYYPLPLQLKCGGELAMRNVKSISS